MCLESLASGKVQTLPCTHSYHADCVAKLREYGIAQVCPMCRAELPPGLDGLYDLGARAYKRVRGRVKRDALSWAALPAAQRVEMEEAAAVLREWAACAEGGGPRALRRADAGRRRGTALPCRRDELGAGACAPV